MDFWRKEYQPWFNRLVREDENRRIKERDARAALSKLVESQTVKCTIQVVGTLLNRQIRVKSPELRRSELRL